ncbi:AEC family transporter [Amaricoccus macauensis]|uniref:AEC family transporter n=1 Tax=Amaricoccus macauensis TaxID=57001 RepID=UPI003C7AAAA7
MLIEVGQILAPITIVVLIGFFLNRRGVITDGRTISSLVVTVASPSLIFSSLTSGHVPPGSIQTMAMAALLCLACAAAIGLVVLKATGGPVRSFLPPLMLPNAGNMGLPLAVLAFGPEGMSFAAAFFMTVTLVQFSVGLSIYAGSVRLGTVFRQPLIFAVAAVLAVNAFGIPVPRVVTDTTTMLGGMMMPAMLLLLGSSLASLGVTDLKPAILVAVGRLGIGVVSAVLAIFILELDGIAAGTVFLLATMPTAVVNYVLAERFQHNASQVAGSVVASTLLTFCCLPTLVWMALSYSHGQVPFGWLIG